MTSRSIESPIERFAFSARKMALVSGPRQCGKTTLARSLLDRRGVGAYRNWDQLEFRREWGTNPSAIVPKPRSAAVPLLVLDEIHKAHLWKRSLKGLYDTLESPCDILVTGSARLNVYKKGGDSMMGRYVQFRLHPFSLREMARPDVPSPDDALQALFAGPCEPRAEAEDRLASLLAYGPFPEPLFAQDEQRAHIWRRNRDVLVIREDLRDLSRLPDLSRLEVLAVLLPDRVGSMFSQTATARALEVSIPTVRRWMSHLADLYYAFELRPYSRNIARSLKRESKVFLWDYGAVRDPAARFENLVASHLLKACHHWTDTGEGLFELFYLRNKEKREIDFLVVRDGKPWLPVEAKTSEREPSPNWARFMPFLPCKRGLQIVREPGWKIHASSDARILVAGAAEALGHLA